MSTATALRAPEEEIADALSGELEAIDLADEAEAADEAPVKRRSRGSRTRILLFAVLPGLALILAVAAGYLKWHEGSVRLAQTSAAESVRAATDGTTAILSYRPDTVDQDLAAAADRLTGGFRDQYTQLVTSVVAPGAKQQQISAAATVPAASSVSATGKHAVVLVFVNQITTIGTGPPTQTTSCVRVTLDKAGDRWLISQFEPV